MRELAASERALLPPGKRKAMGDPATKRGGVRRRRDGASVRQGPATRGGALAVSDLSPEDRIARLEGQVREMQRKIGLQEMTIESLILCLQAASELGQIEFDLQLLKAAKATVAEFMRRGAESRRAGEEGEFCGMKCGEVLEQRFAEFWDANFSE